MPPTPNIRSGPKEWLFDDIPNGPCATKIYQKRLGCLELTKRLFCRAYFERSLSKAIAEENRSKG